MHGEAIEQIVSDIESENSIEITSSEAREGYLNSDLHELADEGISRCERDLKHISKSGAQA